MPLTESNATSLDNKSLSVEGVGESNGINYVYCLNDSKWGGVLEITAKVSLLTANECSIETSILKIAGAKWRAELEKRRDGYLDICLCSLDKHTAVHASAACFTENQPPDTSFSGGYSGRMASGKKYSLYAVDAEDFQRWVSEMSSEPDFTVRIVIRTSSPEIEKSAIYTSGKIGYITWSLRHLDTLCPYSIMSPGFPFAGDSWRFKIFPDYVSSSNLMDVAMATDYLQNFKCFVAVLNHSSPQKSVIKSGFCRKEIGSQSSNIYLGYNSIRGPENGFQSDGWTTFVFHLVLDKPRTSFINILMPKGVAIRIFHRYTPKQKHISGSRIDKATCHLITEFMASLKDDVTTLEKLFKPLIGRSDSVKEKLKSLNCLKGGKPGDDFENKPDSNLFRLKADLCDFWLCNERKDSMQLVQRADYLALTCGSFGDLCDIMTPSLTFLLSKDIGQSVSEIPDFIS